MDGSDLASSFVKPSIAVADPVPLVIDADAALFPSGLMAEAALRAVKADMLRVPQIIRCWLRGRGHLEAMLAGEMAPDREWARRAADGDVLQLAEDEAASGRAVYLITRDTGALLGAARDAFPFVAGVIGAGDETASDARSRAAVLSRRFPQGFDYAGARGSDTNVWRHARTAIPVRPSRVLGRSAAQVAAVGSQVGASTPRLRALIEELRPHQWAKNLLVLVPILLAGRAGDLGALGNSALAFLALCAVASAGYVVNDLWDLADDRHHWWNRRRPLASGRVPIAHAVAGIPLILLAGGVLASMASRDVLLLVALYFVLTLAYSLELKRVAILDGVVLAGLFTIRIGVGIAAAEVPPSPWLLVFSMFLFASLSYAKRLNEIVRLGGSATEPLRGRGYHREDAPLVLAIGTAAGIGAVLILVLYLIHEAFAQPFYGNPLGLWLLPPLLFLFVGRVWLVSNRARMNGDLIAFAFADRSCLALMGLMVAAFSFAWLAPEIF